MPLTNEKVIQAHEALVTLVKNDKEQQFRIPKEVRLALANNLNQTIPVIEDYSKQHNALVASLGVKGKDGQYTIEPGTAAAGQFNIERQNLVHSDSAVSHFETIRYDQFPEGVSIDLLALLLRTGMLVA